MKELFENNDKKISVIKDPFNKRSIESIMIHFSKDYFNKEIGFWKATVDFKNGNTSGSQSTNRCKDWDTMLAELYQIYESLK